MRMQFICANPTHPSTSADESEEDDDDDEGEVDDVEADYEHLEKTSRYDSKSIIQVQTSFFSSSPSHIRIMITCTR